ncbi:oxidoreductase [Streptomyces javensis]|uniref:oxidoreductase n=1 Tax=Streptomyces javensis TaxID=114698 RepID=UPI0033F96077
MTTAATTAGTFELAGFEVGRIGYGTLRLTGNGMLGNSDGPPVDRDLAVAVLRRAVELGVRHIDTASFYFSATRSANELLNRALSPYPDDLLLVTKVGPKRAVSGEWLPPAAPGELRGQVEENLRQLGRDHLDIVNFRVVRQDSIAEHIGALTELRASGLVRHIGLSNITPEHFAEATAITPVVCVQNRYGLEHRVDEGNGLLEACARRGIAYVPFFSISGQRLEARGASTDDAAVPEIARAHGATPAQVRLAWTLHRGPHVLTIPGTASPRHLEENVAAGSLRLTTDELSLLDGRFTQ